ncbi:MAG: hypothetical protein ACYS4T_10475 [Planctomycetota bacterium]|jgi:hypothetical protein
MKGKETIMNAQKLLISVAVIVLLILGTSGTVEAASHDVAWTFGNVSSASYRLDAFEPDDNWQALPGDRNKLLAASI